MILRSKKQQRAGAVSPFVAIMSTVLLAMLAFSVDIAWIVISNNQLQNASDAAALAGADPLMDGYVSFSIATTDSQKLSILTTSLTSARDRAKEFAKYNKAGGANDLVLRDEDIEFGFTDGSNNYSAHGTFDDLITKNKIQTNMPANFPNTIKVLMRRDSQANGSLSMFFASTIGTNNVNLDATASATIYGGKIDNFITEPAFDVGMLPVTYDKAHWDNFVGTGQDADGNTSTGANGLAELQIYPSIKYKGNFGLLSLNDSHVGNSTVVNWIHNGPSKYDIAALQDNGLIPLSKHDPKAWDWNGENGFKASSVMTVNTYVGKTFVLPLFKAYNSLPVVYEAGVGQGSKYDFQIVEFVSVTITSAYKDNKKILVQPGAYVDPFAVFSSTEPAGSSSTLITTFTTPKLSR